MAQPHCYTLIHALSGAEKRAFVVYAQRHVIGGGNQYVTLYQLLESMPAYDADALLAGMRAAKLPVRWYKADLNYLYQLLLDHLRHLHRDKTVHLHLLAYLADIELLLHKGLAEACRKQITKATALATQVEAWPLLHRIRLWERRLAVAHPELGISTAAIVRQMQEATAQQEMFDTALALYEQATVLRVQTVQARSKQKLSGFRRLEQHVLFRQAPNSMGVLTRIRLMQVLCMRYYAGREMEAELTATKSIISLYDKHPILREAYAADYVAAHARVISLLKNMDAQAFTKALQAFRAFEQPEDALHARMINAQIFAHSYMVELSQYLTAGKYERASLLLPAIQQGLKKHGKHLGESIRLSFDFMITYTLFSTGAYAQARDRMHALLQRYSPTLRPDVFAFARLLDLMIHLALGNYSNIRSEYRSVAYQFKKQPKLYATENRILKYFSHPRYYTGHAQFQHLDDLEYDLRHIQHQAMEQYALGYIRFFDWIRSRKERVPMGRLKREDSKG